MAKNETDVAIVGAGPYGLSLAAHLAARGVTFRIFGLPMKFWRDMPVGLNLKSFAFATSIYVPEKGFTFPAYCRANGLEDLEPCTMESFATYGMYMKERFVPSLEPVLVTRVAARASAGTEADPAGFDVTLATGETLGAQRVVFATGLSYLAHMPPALTHLPPEFASHTFFHTDYSRFADKEVVVLGAGASAIEAGALLHEAGARASVLVRDGDPVFHGRMNPNRSLAERLRKPNSVIGPGLKNWVLEKVPFAVHMLPQERRVRFVNGYLGAAAPWWIRDRVQGKVPIHPHTTVVAAELAGDRVRLRLRGPDGERTIEVDHIVAGTGYDSDLDRVSILDSDLRRRVRRIAGAPALSLNFESSVKGAYFLGHLAARSFGPLFRFVCGAEYAAPALARHLAGPVREAKSVVRRWTTGAGSRGDADFAPVRR